MAYTPPAYNAVDLNFTGTYTPPAYNAVNLDFGATTSTVKSRKSRPWQYGSIRGNSFKRGGG